MKFHKFIYFGHIPENFNFFGDGSSKFGTRKLISANETTVWLVQPE